MKQFGDNDESLIQYLLGELDEAEQQAIEQRYIEDTGFYEHLLVAEDALIDAYVQGELSVSRRNSFEDRFLCLPKRRARVEFAKAWMVYAERRSDAAGKESRQRRSLPGMLRVETWPVAFRAAAAAIVILIGGWLIIDVIRLRSRVEQAESQSAALEKKQRELERQIDEERHRSQDLSAQLEREQNPPAQTAAAQANPARTPSGIVSLILIPGLARGAGGSNKLVISPGAQVSLQARFRGGDYKSYRAVIQTVEGREVWSRSGLKPRSAGDSKVIALTLPAGLFANDDYILTLSGAGSAGAVETVAEYSFNVSKK